MSPFGRTTRRKPELESAAREWFRGQQETASRVDRATNPRYDALLITHPGLGISDRDQFYMSTRGPRAKSKQVGWVTGDECRPRFGAEADH